MSEERRKILDLLATGKITAAEAEGLLDAVQLGGSEETPQEKSSAASQKPKYLHVQVNAEPGHHSGREAVNIKVPLILLRAGMKLKSLVPESARDKVSQHLSEHGLDIDLKNLDNDQLDAILSALTESSIDIDSDKEKVRIFCA